MRILITGATSGIAYETAKKLIEQGHSLYLTTHTDENVVYLKEKLAQDHLQAHCFKLDVLVDKDLWKVENIDIDCFISHAGIGIGGSILDTDLQSLKEVYDVNVFGNFKLLQKVYQHMVDRNIHGKIFVTSSIAGMFPLPHLGFYTSSKAAISMLVFTLRKELSVIHPEISISLIEPGAYATGFNQVMIDKKGKFISKDYFYKSKNTITRLQRNLFALIEKKDLSSIVDKIVKEVNRARPKFKIRAPKTTVFLVKLYLFLFR